MKGTNMTSTLPCPACKAKIEISSAQWCQCLSKNLSVICPSCHSCFCKLSTTDRGAEWNVALRAMLERQTEEKFRRALQGSTANSAKSQTVLIVDDDEEIRLIAEYTVQQMGYRTITASHGEEALALVESSRPDIVITDALMPKIDGRQLCRLIKLIDPSIKVVVMSGLYTKSSYRVEAMHQFHADEYLAKPINFERLRNVLEHLSTAA
jgi:CheY-like chemotaxis protein